MRAPGMSPRRRPPPTATAPQSRRYRAHRRDPRPNRRSVRDRAAAASRPPVSRRVASAPMARARVNPIRGAVVVTAWRAPAAARRTAVSSRTRGTRWRGHIRPTTAASTTPTTNPARIAPARPTTNHELPPRATPVRVVVASIEETKNPPRRTNPKASTKPRCIATIVSTGRRDRGRAVISASAVLIGSLITGQLPASDRVGIVDQRGRSGPLPSVARRLPRPFYGRPGFRDAGPEGALQREF